MASGKRWKHGVPFQDYPFGCTLIRKACQVVQCESLCSGACRFAGSSLAFPEQQLPAIDGVQNPCVPKWHAGCFFKL